MLWGDNTYSTKLQLFLTEQWSPHQISSQCGLLCLQIGEWQKWGWRGFGQLLGGMTLSIVASAAEHCTAVTGAVSQKFCVCYCICSDRWPWRRQRWRSRRTEQLKWIKSNSGWCSLFALIAGRSSKFSVKVQTSLHLHAVQLAQSCTFMMYSWLKCAFAWCAAGSKLH